MGFSRFDARMDMRKRRGPTGADQAEAGVIFCPGAAVTRAGPAELRVVAVTQDRVEIATMLESKQAGMRAPGAILLVSCYELGHQPQGLAMPLAFLERAGYIPATLDVAVQPLEAETIRQARLVAISTPMH